MSSTPKRLRTSVTTSEFVSILCGVSSSVPIAMISATFIVSVCSVSKPLDERSTGDVSVHPKQRVLSAQNNGFGGCERQPYDARARKVLFRLTSFVEAYDPSSTCQRCRHIQPPLRVESQALRPSQAPEVGVHFACSRNAIDRIET